MQITTMSQRGQVVVPKEIREKIGLNISDLLKVDIQDGNVILSPVSKTDQVFGMFKSKKIITKSDIKKSYRENIAKKFSGK